MDQQPSSPAKTVSTGPVVGLVIVLFISSAIGGWLYVDYVRGELEMRIQALETRFNARVSTQTPSSGVIEREAGPLSYRSDPSLYTVDRSTFSVHEWFDAEQFSEFSEECGVHHPASYYEDLEDKIPGGVGIRYTFTYLGPQQNELPFSVRLIPNPRYLDFASFQKDFQVCAAGEYQPALTSSDWLAWTSACGSGYDDGSGNPIGCQVVSRALEGTLKLQ